MLDTATSRLPRSLAVLAVGLTIAASPLARAATLRVGPAENLHVPSQAASVARDGDTISIAPGSYFDCAVWSANGLTIVGEGGDVVLTDRACEGKAAFVIRGNGITLRGLTFARIRVPDRNGAGVRVEGQDLAVENSRFENNQVGILAADAEASSLNVSDCVFDDNGGEATTADILAGRIGLLRVQQSQFTDTKSGASVTSAASRTELIGNRFTIGNADRTSPTAAPYIVGIANGGLTMQDNTFSLNAIPPKLGIVLVDGDVFGTAGAAVSISGTMLTNRTGRPTVLLRDWSGGSTTLSANRLDGGDVAVSRGGLALHRAKQAVHLAIYWLRGIAGFLHRAAVSILHRVA